MRTKDKIFYLERCLNGLTKTVVEMKRQLDCDHNQIVLKEHYGTIAEVCFDCGKIIKELGLKNEEETLKAKRDVLRKNLISVNEKISSAQNKGAGI